MVVHPSAGKPAPSHLLVDISRLKSAYFSEIPDPEVAGQRVAFGTSGHRGSALRCSFNEWHILAITQAICDYRKTCKITGPLFLGMDTHALSEPALLTALEVLAANRVTVCLQPGGRYTPTPLISHAILTYNRGRSRGRADGIVITPSHNPPEDGGLKYNPPEGGPAETSVTLAIQNRANTLLEHKLEGIQRTSAAPLSSEWVRDYDFIQPYVEELAQVLDMQRIAMAGLKIGVDPLGGASIDVWDPLADRYGFQLDVVNRRVDPTFSFMRLDRDGKIRMDCSSPYAMAGLIELRDRFDIAFGNDADSDRHGIVTRSAGLMNPNHYLAAAIWYLFNHRPQWPGGLSVGKTLVSSAMIDRVAEALGKKVIEVPVGFKWFVEGLLRGTLGVAGEESAGASFVRRRGQVWTTDKDGIIMDLLACEITACTGKDPSELYVDLEHKFGSPVFRRLEAPASPRQKEILKGLSAPDINIRELAGERIQNILSRAPGNGEPVGGVKVTAANGWFAARPSGTEDIYKIYAESFLGEDHLQQILDEAQQIVSSAFKEFGE